MSLPPGDSYYPTVKVRQWGDNAAEGKKIHCDVKHDSWTENGKNEEFSPAKMLDCNKRSYWCSVAGTNEATVTIDLGQPLSIFSMRIVWKFFAKRFNIYVANDENSFTNSNDEGDFMLIYEQDEVPSVSKPDIPIPTFTARFCRLHMLEAGKKFQGESILGIVSLELVSGLHVQIQDGALKGRSYKLHQPTRTLVALDSAPAAYRQSLAHALTDDATKLGKGKDKVKKVLLAKTMQKFAIGSQWRLSGNEDDGDLQPAVKVMSINADSEVFVQRLIGKPTLIRVQDPAKKLRKLKSAA